jgi:hypothetical protein
MIRLPFTKPICKDLLLCRKIVFRLGVFSVLRHSRNNGLTISGRPGRSRVAAQWSGPLTMVQIQPDGDALTWKYKINQKIEIQAYQKNGGFCGKGIVVLLDERQFDFEFKII